MKFFLVTPWKNTWVPYWTKFLEEKGHQVEWLIKEKMESKELSEGMARNDVSMCMWTNELAVIMSKSKPKGKKLMVFLRSYEIFNCDLTAVKWENVDKFFLLNEAHVPIVKHLVPDLKINMFKNGIDLDMWPFCPKEQGPNIAAVCDINFKKGIELMVQAIHEIAETHPEVVLNHIGQMQDNRIWVYLCHITKYLQVNWNNFGYLNDHRFVLNFLKNQHYIISASVAEGNPNNVMEAMAVGLKPLVHAWPGSEIQFPGYTWGTFKQLRELYDGPYEPEKYRQYAEENYDYHKNYQKIYDVMETVL